MHVYTKSFLKTTTNSSCVWAHLANKAHSDSEMNIMLHSWHLHLSAGGVNAMWLSAHMHLYEMKYTEVSSKALSVRADSHTARGNCNVFFSFFLFDDPFFFFLISLIHSTCFITLKMTENESSVKPVFLHECSSEWVCVCVWEREGEIPKVQKLN